MPSRDEQIIELVIKRYHDSADYHQPYYEKSKKYYDLFRGTTSKRGQVWRNNIHIPFAISILESDVSRKVQSAFGAWPVVEFAGYAPEDRPNARRNEILISAQMKDCDSFAKAVDFFTSADIYGTAFAQVGWTTKAEEERYREMNEIMGAEEIKQRSVITFDGPDWEVLDMLDCFPQPGIKRIDDMLYFIKRYHRDLDVLERQANLGMYDLDAIAELKREPGQSNVASIVADRQSYGRNMQDYNFRKEEKFAKPVEIIEYWGVVPNEFGKDGVINRVISIANERVVLRDRDFPFWIKKKPFFSYSPMPDPHYLWGIGKIEPIAKLNMTANKLASQKLDVLELFGSPSFITSAVAGLDKENLFISPGRVFQSDAPDVSDAHIRPISPDLRGTEGLYAEIEQLWRWSQQATGIVEDTIMGGRGASRETATGFSGRQEGVVNRLMCEAILAGEGFVEPLANYMRALNRQFLKLPYQVKILGSSATTNPITGYPLPSEPVDIDHKDVNMDYRARAIGAIHMLSKSARRQDMMALTGIVQANPAFMRVVNWVAWLRKLVETFEMSADELTNTQPTQLNMAASMQGGGGEGIPDIMSMGG